MIERDQHLSKSFEQILWNETMFQRVDLSKEMANDSVAKVVKPVVLVGRSMYINVIPLWLTKKIFIREVMVDAIISMIE